MSFLYAYCLARAREKLPLMDKLVEHNLLVDAVPRRELALGRPAPTRERPTARHRETRSLANTPTQRSSQK
ncbi:MAG: hypothetical protein LM573_04875 [Thermofilum sp.]|nr:hypothetical protein [Thermofilum sp.]